MLMKSGLWAAAHEARTDISMWLGLLFLIIVAAGAWSGDGKLAQIKKSPMYRRRSVAHRRFLATEVAWNDMPQRMCFGARGRLVA